MTFYSAFQSNAFWNQAYQIARGAAAAIALDPNGNRNREYQPTYHELKERREIERKLEEAELNIKANQIRIEELEFKRLRDLADQAMQLELLQLLAQQNELQMMLDALQQQKLRALNDDDEFVALLMCLN